MIQPNLKRACGICMFIFFCGCIGDNITDRKIMNGHVIDEANYYSGISEYDASGVKISDDANDWNGSVGLDNAYAYPNPFKPGVGHTKITFVNLTARATIEIYKNPSTLVRRLEEIDGDGIFHWDTTDSSGGLLPSGIYHVKIVGSGSSGNAQTEGDIQISR